jgi:hypothetical protein
LHSWREERCKASRCRGAHPATKSRSINWCQFSFVGILWASPETPCRGTATAERRVRPRLSCPQPYSPVRGGRLDRTHGRAPGCRQLTPFSHLRGLHREDRDRIVCFTMGVATPLPGHWHQRSVQRWLQATFSGLDSATKARVASDGDAGWFTDGALELGPKSSWYAWSPGGCNATVESQTKNKVCHRVTVKVCHRVTVTVNTEADVHPCTLGL